MISRRTSGCLLIALFTLVVAFPGGFGQAAGPGGIVDAAKQGDLPSVRALIARRVDVNQTASDGSTALLWAAYNGDVPMARALIAAGAKVDTPNRFGVTPLLQASRAGDAPLMGALLDAGASPGATHANGETPLMAASRTGLVDAVRLLLTRRADVNATGTYQKETALTWAAAEGHADVVGMLLEAGANPNLKASMTALEKREHADHPTGGFTPLMFAARAGHESVLRALVKGGADLDAVNGDGATALVIAIINDRFDLAKTLVELGADPKKDSSLYFAVDMHDATTDMRARDGSRLRADHRNQMTAMDLVTFLLDKGADPNKPFQGQLHNTSLCCGETANGSPFFRAAIASDVEVLKLLAARGATIDWIPTEYKAASSDGSGGGGGRGANANVGKTPLMVAMAGGKGAAFGGGPGFNRLGPPPFREAGNRTPLDALKVLLDAGANPNAKAPDGSTPLHQAVQAKNLDFIRTLAAKGASFEEVNKDNLTPLLLAEKPETAKPPDPNADPNAPKEKTATKEEVIALVRELMRLAPDAPAPPPLPKAAEETKKPADATSTSTNGGGAR